MAGSKSLLVEAINDLLQKCEHKAIVYNGIAKLPATRTCIFCGERPLTKEHILSDWLGPLIRTRMVNYELAEAHIGPSGTTMKSKDAFGPYCKPTRPMCFADCNNTWMSGIVEAAKPTVQRLIVGDTCRISAQEQARLRSMDSDSGSRLGI